jgi:hypothetical protein
VRGDLAEQAEGSAFLKGEEANMKRSSLKSAWSEQSDEDNTKHINRIVSKALNDMLSDEGLTKCRAQ